MTRAEAGTDRRARRTVGASLGTVLSWIILSQLVFIKLCKFVCHSSTEAGRQGHQLFLVSFSQALSERGDHQKQDLTTPS